jgi:5-methylcytosine-specific restriction endonuclease McrA
VKPALPVPAGPDAALRRRCLAALREHRRRARADRRALDYGLADLEALARASPCCAYCGTLLLPGAFVFDHAMPTARICNYGLANLRVCCAGCNTAKGIMSEAEYHQLLDLLRGFHPRAGGDVLRRLRAGGARYATGRGRRDCGT